MGESIEDPLEAVYGYIEGKGYMLDREHPKKYDEDNGIFVLPASNKKGDRFMVKITRFYDPAHADRYRELINEFRPLTLHPENFLVRIVDEVTPPLGESEFETYSYVIMDAGECNLEEKIRGYKRAGEQIPYSNAVDIVKQVATALKAVAGRDKVHRDVKPANVIVRGARHELTDFHTLSGIDKGEEGSPLVSLSSMTRGTPGYLAPELDDEEEKNNPDSEARDIYSLGIIFYQLLTTTTHRELVSHPKYREMQRNPKKFFEYLGIGGKIKSTVLREIAKKMLFYDPEKQAEWQEKFRSGKRNIPLAETPWYERPTTHQEVLEDLEFAEEFHRSFDEIERALDTSVDKNSAELAKALKPGNNGAKSAEDRPGYLVQKIEDLRASLRTKGYSTAKGKRHWLHDAFEEIALAGTAAVHVAEISQCFVERLQEFHEGAESTRNYVLREEAGRKLREFATILRGYRAIVGSDMAVIMPSGDQLSSKLLMGVEELAEKYSPEDFLKKLEDEHPGDEDGSKALIARLNDYAASIAYDGTDSRILERIKSLKARIENKKQAVKTRCVKVNSVCNATIQAYLETITADAEKKTVQTHLRQAMEELEALGCDGFLEVRCTKAELTGIDYVMGGLYTGRWDAAKSGEFERLYELAKHDEMRFLATSSAQTLVGLAQEASFFDYVRDMLGNFETEEKSMSEAEKRGDEIDEQKRKNSKDFTFGKKYFAFVKEHVENIATTALRVAGDAYSAACKADHRAATGAATEVLSLMPIANHPVVKARREIYEKREAYRSALYSTAHERGIIGGDLFKLANGLEEAGAISKLEVNAYGTLLTENVIKRNEDPESQEDEEFLRLKKEEAESQLRDLTKEHGGKYEDVLNEDDLLVDIAVIMCLEGAGRHDDAFAACDAASAPDKFANEPWFVYMLAKHAVKFERDDQRVIDTEKKLMGLERKLCSEKHGRIYLEQRGNFYFKTARTPGNLQQAAKDYERAGMNEEREKAQDCVATAESINGLLEVDKLTPLPETARDSLASKWKTAEGNIGHLKTVLGEDHPFIDQTLLDLCRWVVDYERLVKREIEEDRQFIMHAGMHLSSLKSRRPRTDEENVALQAKIGGMEKALGAFKADMARFERDILPFVQKAFELFKDRKEIERWLARIRGGI